MTPRIAAALSQLNAAYAPMGKVYQVQQEGDKFALIMPSGGSYPVSSGYELEVRLMNLTHAATGRSAR